jgi:hypothetical protein
MLALGVHSTLLKVFSRIKNNQDLDANMHIFTVHICRLKYSRESRIICALCTLYKIYSTSLRCIY